MPEYVQTVIDYMGTRGCYRSRFFLRSIVVLDNMLALQPSLVSSAHFSKELVENVSIFFCHLQPSSDSTYESAIYSVLYLILLMISGANQCLMLKKILNHSLFRPSFLKKLTSFQYTKCHQIVKIMPIILAYILRTKKTFIKDMNLKFRIFSLFP